MAESDASSFSPSGRKRSQTVSLVLVAGAGALALGLGRFDPSQGKEDVLVYRWPSECFVARLHDPAYCMRSSEAARNLHPQIAPRYTTLRECEAHHGADHCVAGEKVTPTVLGKFLPRMAGYMIGRRPEQEVEPQPVFEHAAGEPSDAGGHGGGGYCTAAGTRIVTGSGGRSSVARVSSADLRRTSFGGFGSTGRAYSSSSRSFFSGG